jgi:UDP-N-acetylmuramoyl-tripeptide--D-alanyl-D-alanine ligase
MDLVQLKKTVNGEFLNLIENKKINRFEIDSRRVKEGDFFIPLKGQNADGHQYIEDAIEKGVVGYFSEKPLNFKNGILVKDTYQALVEVGKYKRNQVKAVIGITGTSGKTSTKELMNFVLSNLSSTYATQGNYNNEIGVPLTLANIPENIDFAIIEMGAGKVGDIDYLGKILNQDISVLVSVGYGHVGKFGSFENVIKGKGEIFNYGDYSVLPSELKKIYNPKNPITYGEDGDIEIRDIKIVKDGTVGVIKYKNDKIGLKIPVYNIGVFKNIGAVAGVLYHLGYDPIKNLEILKDFKSSSQRGEIIKIGNFTIIDDSYNANPLSVKNAIDVLNSMEGFKIFVLGDMLELGEYSQELHREIGKLLNASYIDYIMLYGNETKYVFEEVNDKSRVKHFDNKDDIAENILKFSDLRSVVLVKGSRGMKMEDVILKLRVMLK